MEQQETLREALDRIMLLRYPAEFKLAFDEVQQQHGHAVRMVAADRNWLETFNCYASALGIVEYPRYQALVRVHKKSALTNSAFVSELLLHDELREIGVSAAKAGTIVLYFADDIVTHGGVIISGNGRIRSKWGPSELYEHDLWEIPGSYGDRVKFFAAPDPERIIDLLEEHVGR
jgi:hypothetical protein